jgi:hypothetical protein
VEEMMNKISLVVVLPMIALLAGVIFATFYHKYDTSRGLFEDLNLSIEDLSGIAGNIVSLQKDATGKLVSIVSGKWLLLITPTDNLAAGTSKVEFESNLTMQKIDGKSTNKVSLSNFKLKESTVLEEVATLDGDASLLNLDTAISLGNVASKNITVPLHIIISNSHVISISSGSNLFREYFGVSPVYGNVVQRD